MKILFITAHKYLPQMRGGLQNSTHQLCNSLCMRGHKVSVLAGLLPGGFLALESRLKMQINNIRFGCKVSKDLHVGYPVWRAWYPWDLVDYVYKKEKPDLIVVLAMQSVHMALEARKTKTPILMQLQDIEFHQHGGAFAQLGDVPCVANSHFTAAAYHNAFGVMPTVIHPFINTEEYKTTTTRANVTFINPVVEKGRDIALEIARLCPEIPFSFYEAWPLSLEQRQFLMQKLTDLPNVTFYLPQIDMRKVYGKCKILLAPSIWEEAYGRIATEAQFSGIPVIASNRGGLPEAVGSGGILINPDGPIDLWVDAVRKLWQDDSTYSKMSAAALAYSQRPESSIAFKIDAWERVLLAASGKQNIRQA
jgi:glycosyltransferase involved in cell wall biosynthesis